MRGAPERLDEAWDDVWRRLTRAVRDRRHAFRTPVFVTVGPDGAPSARTVVLRSVDVARSELVLHTDARSEKVEHLSRESRVTWCFYDARARLQLRAAGTARVQRDGPAVDADYERLHPIGRRSYLVSPGPGTPLDAPGDGLEHLHGVVLDAHNTAPGRAVFTRVVCTVEWVERLDLDPDGHRRARWIRAADGWVGSWLVP